MDAQGNAMVLWLQSEGPYMASNPDDVWARRYTATGGWEPPMLVDHQDYDMMHIDAARSKNKGPVRAVRHAT